MNQHCTCTHHRLSHTYTAGGNVGRCLAGPKDKRCTCSEFVEAKEATTHDAK